MYRALLLSMYDLGAWSANAALSPGPGGKLPYGMHHLSGGFKLRWSDGQRRGVWRTGVARSLGGAVRRATPGLQGSLGACYAGPLLSGSDVVLSVFENAGLGFARLQAASKRGRSLPHVMVSCWLAEDCKKMSSSQIQSVRRSIRSVAKVVVYSSNQIAALDEVFGLGRDRVVAISFGVDTDYYDAELVGGPTGGGGVVAVGSDSRRDYATLLEAVRIADVPLTLVCQPRNIAGLDISRFPQVKVLQGVFNDKYRRILLSADLVVTPTVAPAYPSGQSVVLEAMSMGKATLTTDSPAIRDYVSDGLNGVLMPAQDPAEVARLINDLLGDRSRRQALGSASCRMVRERFGLSQMWQSVSGIMAGECG